MSSRITGPLFKWYGSKWSASKHYTPPQYDVVREPFAGGAGYALRHFGRRVQLSEVNNELILLWRWLIKCSESDIREIPTGLPPGTDILSLGLSDGQAHLLRCWQRTNNNSVCWHTSPWGNKPGQWTENTRARVAEQSQAIKHWVVVSSDGMTSDWNFLGNYPATWFIDPPYEYNYRYGRPALDYGALGAWCSGLWGQVIVCEAACPKTGREPRWLPFRNFRRTITSRRKANNHHHSNELVWENSDICASLSIVT